MAADRSPNTATRAMLNRPGVLSLNIREKAALYAAYMPFLKGGGIFIPTSRAYQLGEDMKPHDVGAYCNYIDPLLTNWQNEFYGGNYDELVRIKKEWDPQGHFNFQQAIGSPFEPTPGNFAPLFHTFID